MAEKNKKSSRPIPYHKIQDLFEHIFNTEKYDVLDPNKKTTFSIKDADSPLKISQTPLGAGAKEKKEVPQSDIDSFVRDNLSGESSKKYYHKTGPHKGKVNIQRLTDDYKKGFDPYNEPITPRQLRERIKKAVTKFLK